MESDESVRLYENAAWLPGRAALGNAARRSGVMVRGRWLPEAQIQKRLTAMAEARR
mgnify:CR=1 FL=1